MSKSKTEYQNLIEVIEAMNKTIEQMPSQGYSEDVIKGVQMAKHVFFNRFKRLSWINLHQSNRDMQKRLTRAELMAEDVLEDNGALLRRIDKLEDELDLLKQQYNDKTTTI